MPWPCNGIRLSDEKAQREGYAKGKQPDSEAAQGPWFIYGTFWKSKTKRQKNRLVVARVWNWEKRTVREFGG